MLNRDFETCVVNRAAFLESINVSSRKRAQAFGVGQAFQLCLSANNKHSKISRSRGLTNIEKNTVINRGLLLLNLLIVDHNLDNCLTKQAYIAGIEVSVKIRHRIILRLKILNIQAKLPLAIISSRAVCVCILYFWKQLSQELFLICQITLCDNCNL